MTNASTTHVEIRAALRRLAEWQPSDDGSQQILSAYLDLRPDAGNPQVHPGLVVLRDKLRDEPDGEQLVERLTSYIEGHLLPGATAAAIFASGNEVLESVTTAAELHNDVSVGDRAHLLPLARLADAEGVLVAVADTNTLRVFSLRSGQLIELGVLDDDPAEYKGHAQGGWSQSRFQRHVEENREAFAELAAEALEGLATMENASMLILAAGDVAAPLLRDALSKRLSDMTRGQLHIGIRASTDDVAAIALPEIERLRAEEVRDAVERLIDAAESDGMGITGAEATRRALELGQVSDLLLDSGPDATLQEETAEDLIRQAALTDATIRFVDDERLRERDGVGGFLRFRLDRAINEPVDEADSAVEGAATVSPTGEPIPSSSS